MAAYELSGKIGTNDFKSYYLTTDVDIETLPDYIGSTDQHQFDVAEDLLNSDLNKYGIEVPWRNVSFPHSSTLELSLEFTQKFPGLYTATLLDNSEIIVGGVSCGNISIKETSTTFSYASDFDNEIFPDFSFNFQAGAQVNSARHIIYIGPSDSIVNGKFSVTSKDIFKGELWLYYKPLKDEWSFYIRKFTILRSVKSVLDGIDAIESIETDDPYTNGGNATTGGGDGSYDNESIPIDIPKLPNISASLTGFITLYNPSSGQLKELSDYMWSGLFDIEGWRKLFANPMDSILGLSIVPVEIPSSELKEVKIGNISTGISLSLASQQFVEVDCGEINVNEYWGAYLDYEPYTQAQIFLPYIGTRPISVDEIMGKTVKVVYHVDILTGACTCFVKCGESVLYTYNGQCSIPIPITGANYTSVVNGVISVAASIGSVVASGGATAPTAIPSIASSVVNQMKPSIEKSGSISGSAGILNMQTPYLILIRPRQALPSKQNEFIGYPSLITVQLTELSGYTEIQSIHLEGISATQEELAEIESLLKEGVIF